MTERRAALRIPRDETRKFARRVASSGGRAELGVGQRDDGEDVVLVEETQRYGRGRRAGGNGEGGGESVEGGLLGLDGDELRRNGKLDAERATTGSFDAEGEAQTGVLVAVVAVGGDEHGGLHGGGRRRRRRRR
ncbi:hypothetical protein FGB62_87g066 [Gracilaria domingensis]|nr:hypothetical protein FGB62_87g066 [Gracilaria domingensis]